MERHGCFVFQVARGGGGAAAVPVRSGPEPGAAPTGLAFGPGELLAVDLIRTPPTATAPVAPSALLRLADGAGWVLRQGHGDDTNLRELAVETGLFPMVVDHFPAGLAPRRHPTDRRDLRVDAAAPLRPLERIHCDRRVARPDTGCVFYRRQGTPHWVYDRRTDADRGTVETMLLEDHRVQTGTFAFQAVRRVPIWSVPGHPQPPPPQHRTGLDLHRGELVMVNVIRDAPQGPWLRLACGTGWVPEACGAEACLEPVVVEHGAWTFRVLNHPAGLRLRTHPIDEHDDRIPVAAKTLEDRARAEFSRQATVIGPDTAVECDKRITSPVTGVNWYRVVGTQGWIFDQRHGQATLEPCQATKRLQGLPDNYWTVDLVRGMAAMVAGIEEMRHSDAEQLIHFVKGELHIKVWYKIRTVTVTTDGPRTSRAQISHKDCSKEDLIQVFRNAESIIAQGNGLQHPKSPTGAAEFFDSSGYPRSHKGFHSGTNTAYDRSRFDFGVIDLKDEDLEDIESTHFFDSGRHRRSALMKYGTRYHKPPVPMIRSYDNSHAAIKGTRRKEKTSLAGDSSVHVEMPSMYTSSGTIGTRRETDIQSHDVSRDATNISMEDEHETREDLLRIERQFSMLCKTREHMIETITKCDQRRSAEAKEMYHQSKSVLDKLEALIDPGFAFWAPHFGTWSCDKCGEACNNRHNLMQHAEASGH